MSKSQNALILAHLQKGLTITPLEALKMFDAFRLAARISDIKKLGHRVAKEMVKKNGKRFAKYSLPKMTGA